MTRVLINPTEPAANDDRAYEIVVVGTEHYTRELRGIAGEGDVARDCTATLRFDPLGSPEYAVCVIVAGGLVGHLTTEDAARFTRRYGVDSRNCRAVIIGCALEPRRLDVCLDLGL